MAEVLQNHALVDGNQRLGCLATAVFLELNGVDVVTVANDDVYTLVMAVAAGDPAVPELAERLRRLP